jgi:dihydroorotate dehydrogenase
VRAARLELRHGRVRNPRLTITRSLAKLCPDAKATIVAVRGIRCAKDASAYQHAGTSLVQVYRVYRERGARAITAINNELAAATINSG